MRAFVIAATVAFFLCVAARGADAFADCPDDDGAGKPEAGKAAGHHYHCFAGIDHSGVKQQSFADL